MKFHKFRAKKSQTRQRMMTITGEIKLNQLSKWPHQQISIWLSQMLFQNRFTAKDLEKLTTWIQDLKFFSFSGKCKVNVILTYLDPNQIQT